ncbi:hypothetical protein [Cupriavidus basilensis]|uniref:hypothetical protein n=1 Tax=Cupriavidus basilensis TaxID=68895 RepID=UPI000A9C9127|nr:hypothetical protein [Cupriavidus basilensis]
MKFDPNREPTEYSDVELIALLKDRYTAMPVPSCRICGGALSVARTGGGEATQWACSEIEDDPDNPGRPKHEEGRGLVDDHFERSCWTQDKPGDEFVLEATSRLKRTKTESEQKIKQLEAQLAMMVIAAKKVLSDVDDDGVAERSDMAVLALRNAVTLCPAKEILSVATCARRVHSKFGADSNWSEWRDLAASLEALDAVLYR